MTTARTQRRREIKEKQKIAAENLRETKKIEALSKFHEKYIKCSETFLEPYGNNTETPAVSLAVLHVAEELVTKMLQDASTILKKTNRQVMEPGDVNLASMNLYKPKDTDRKMELRNLINSQRLPPINNSAMHYAPLQRSNMLSMDYANKPLESEKSNEETDKAVEANEDNQDEVGTSESKKDNQEEDGTSESKKDNQDEDGDVVME